MKKLDVWYKKRNLTFLMYGAIGIIYVHYVSDRVYGSPSIMVKEGELIFSGLGLLIAIFFWAKTLEIFESPPNLKKYVEKTLMALPWIYLLLSLVIQIYRLYDQILPDFGITNTVILVEGFRVLLVILFGFWFYIIGRNHKCGNHGD